MPLDASVLRTVFRPLRFAVFSEAELRLGSKRETIKAAEVGDEEKPPVLRAYLENWASMTKGSFGVDEKATDEELRDIAPSHPVFRITS